MQDRWDQASRAWLAGNDLLSVPLEAWWSSYCGSGEGEPTRDAMAEPYVGNWDAPRLVTLALNPGQAEFGFQGRDGRFAAEVARLGYGEWAKTDPYGGAEWERFNTVNRARRSGRRVNPHREKLLRFARRLTSDPNIQGSDLLMVELYPWHSRRVNAKISPPASVLHEFVWAPLGEVDVDTVFAFGKPWLEVANRLGLEATRHWGPTAFRSPAREGAVFALPSGHQRLVVLWQAGYAGPPGDADVDRLIELLETPSGSGRRHASSAMAHGLADAKLSAPSAAAPANSATIDECATRRASELTALSRMDDRDAIAALISDLHWQIDQLAPRGIKDKAGNPYNPSYYKRGLRNAIGRGGLAVADYVRRLVYGAPSDGYKKLEDADSLDLACEALVSDASKPYARLFTDADRTAASKRLAPHIAAIERTKAATIERIEARRAAVPRDIAKLRDLAATATDPEDAIAINSAILTQAPQDSVAMNRLGRAYQAIGSLDAAEQTFRNAIDIDPTNKIATSRLGDVLRQKR